MIDAAKYNKEVGERLRKIRAVLNLTPAEIAEKIGMTIDEYLKYEKGEDSLVISQVMTIAELSPMIDRGYIIEGRMSYDFYIEAAMKKIPKDEMQKLLDEFGITTTNLETMSEEDIVKYNMKLYEYGVKHINDEDLREVPSINIFTQMFEQRAKTALEQ